MRKVKRWRYYCEYCKKSGGSGYHMESHERGCTNNPNRKCGMCGTCTPVATLIEALGDGKDLSKIRKEADNCPACILAAIRQSKLQYMCDDEGMGFRVDFDFKAEKAEWWKNVNEEGYC
jgi:hypothetical protein